MNEQQKANEIKRVREFIEADFKKNEGWKEGVRKARACLKYIKCIVCFDTGRIIRIGDGTSWGIWYDVYHCPICTNIINGQRLERHEKYQNAISNNRQVPCSDTHRQSENHYSHTIYLNVLFQKEFELIDIKAEADKLVEDAKKEINILKKENEEIKTEKEYYVTKYFEVQQKYKNLEAEYAKKNQELVQKQEDLKKEYLKKQDELQIEIDKTKQLNKPDFNAQETVGLVMKRTSMSVKFDIQEFVSQITAIISSAAGNIISLPNVIGNISVRLKACAESGEHENYKFEKIRNEKDELVYIRYDYVKITKSNSFNFNYLKLDYSSAKEFIYVYLMILKPVNQSAINQCEELMIEDSKKIFEKVRSADKDKK